jgi:hypothetical protein
MFDADDYESTQGGLVTLVGVLALGLLVFAATVFAVA